MATVSLAGVQLPIEGSSYSRVVFIILDQYLILTSTKVVYTTKDFYDGYTLNTILIDIIAWR